MTFHRILKGATFGSNFGSPGFSASYLIQTNNYNILFDIGHNGLRNILLNELNRYGLSPKSIDTVILSHDHWDHIMNYTIFDNSRFIIGHSSANRRTGDWAYVPFFRDKLKEMDTVFVKKNDLVIFDKIRIIAVPGHTEADIAAVVEDKDDKLLFTGDMITSAQSLRNGRPDLIFYSEEEAKKSYKYMLSLLPDIILPGHDAPFRIHDMEYTSEIDCIEATVSGNVVLRPK